MVRVAPDTPRESFHVPKTLENLQALLSESVQGPERPRARLASKLRFEVRANLCKLPLRTTLVIAQPGGG